MKYRHFVTLSLGICLFSCAYFNTFYNAKQYFKKAEKIRMEKAGESIPVSAIDAYSKVIDKSRRVLEEYPDTRYRKNALLLIGQAHFYRQEYRLAEATFQQFEDEFGETYPFERGYWQAMVKWRQGKSQAALNALTSILDEPLSDDQKAQVHLSIAEIQLELNEDKLALENLLKGAELTSDADQRGQIYYRISVLAFDKQDYEMALSANKNVIRYALSKKRIEEANLQIVRIHRLLGDWDVVMSEIKSILVDARFTRIHGNLELELVRLYQMQGKDDMAKNRLESIIKDYARSENSAEAYYMLGEIAINEDWDLDESEKQFSQVTREYRKSQYTPTANLRVKQIKSYKDSQTSITTLLETFVNTETDSVKSDSSAANEVQTADLSPNYESLANHYYNMGELEAFHFNRPTEAIIHFMEIIDSLPTTGQYVKSLFTAAYLAAQQGDTTMAIALRDTLLDKFPRSEFADYMRKRYGMEDLDGSSNQLFRQGELGWQTDPGGSLDIFKQILHQDEDSDVAARSAMFLAVMYDRHFTQADSAIYYYDWLQSHRPESDQALATINRYEELQKTISILNQVDTMEVKDSGAEIIAESEGIVGMDNQEAVEDTTIEN
ncbi:MAG TPA: tetratricopeptide repeat protein [Candidatus Marinimicrobia bacterium]|nr:tetratricopeptide repeat protein [Candidatus Neomarinimicrobiota bacterium]